MRKSKSNKITATTIVKSMKLEEDRYIPLVFGIEEDSVEVMVKPRLSLSERSSFVKDVSNMVFIDTERGDVDYAPEFYNFAIGYCVISYFTNITLPSSTQAAWDFIEKTDIVNRIASVVPNHGVDDIIDAAREYVGYRRVKETRTTRFEALFSSVIDVANAFKDKIGNANMEDIMSYVAKNAPELKGQIEQLVKSQSAEFAE